MKKKFLVEQYPKELGRENIEDALNYYFGRVKAFTVTEIPSVCECEEPNYKHQEPYCGMCGKIMRQPEEPCSCWESKCISGRKGQCTVCGKPIREVRKIRAEAEPDSFTKEEAGDAMRKILNKPKRVEKSLIPRDDLLDRDIMKVAAIKNNMCKLNELIDVVNQWTWKHDK